MYFQGEFHHNVLFHNAKMELLWTRGNGWHSYQLLEGWPAFQPVYFGEEYIGPWVTGVQGADLEIS